jgi:hypothetical protein
MVTGDRRKFKNKRERGKKGEGEGIKLCWRGFVIRAKLDFCHGLQIRASEEI